MPLQSEHSSDRMAIGGNGIATPKGRTNHMAKRKATARKTSTPKGKGRKPSRTDSALAIFEALNRGEFPPGHEHAGTKGGRGRPSFTGSIRDGTLDLEGFIPKAKAFDRARSLLAIGRDIDRDYQNYKNAGGDCSKGSRGQAIRKEAQHAYKRAIAAALEAARS
jgi:hypothetical protein